MSVIVPVVSTVIAPVVEEAVPFEPSIANFDGLTALFRVLLSSGEYNEGTVSLWVSKLPGATDQKIYDVGDAVASTVETTRLTIDPTGLIDSRISNWGGSPPWTVIAFVGNKAISSNSLHHIFMTYRNDTVAGPGTQIMQMWIDGVFVGSDTTFQPTSSATVSFLAGDQIVIGARHNLEDFLVGQISEIVTYDKYLDPVVNIDKFYNPDTSPEWLNGTPVSLGYTGEVNGVLPMNYLGGPEYTIADWNAGINRGTSDNFTLIGGPIT